LIAKGVVSGPQQISCSDPFEPTVAAASAKGIITSQSNIEIANNAQDVIILAVKPNNIVSACSDICKSKNTTAVIISIAAGITLKTLELALPGRKIVRVMPNTPCLVGAAASGYCMGKEATDPRDKHLVDAIFGSVGMILEIKEDLLNAVTGLSGSGPAYVFEFIEALADGGVRVGLSRQDAMILAAQTVKGAAEMILQTGQHPGVLKDQGKYLCQCVGFYHM
jgi:pyrroline-5-carboxylate reductase